VFDFAGKKEKLLREFSEGRLEAGFSSAYTVLLDDYLRELFSRSLKANGQIDGLALVSLGGYGRGEMSPYSDVDLLFLHDDSLEDKTLQPYIESILYPLWDLKIDVGHVSRTLNECQGLGRTDFVTLVSLLEGRFLAGDDKLHALLKQWLGHHLGSKLRGRQFLKELKANVHKRHDKYGRSPYLLEPNVKEGQGGLRDIQAVLWLGQGLYNLSTFDELVRAGFLPQDLAPGLAQARDFMNKVRTGLHIQAGAKNDTLTFEYQEGLAGFFGYQAQGDISSVERFMQDYYTQVYIITHGLDYCLARAEEDLRPVFVKRLTVRPKTVQKGLQVRRGQVELVSSAEVRRRPILMMRALEVAMTEGLKISHGTQDIIRKNLDLIDDGFRRDPKAAESFFHALTARSYDEESGLNNLVIMKDINFLSAYIPELAPVRALVQNDAYHVYTVDVHLLLTVWELKKMASIRALSGENDFEQAVMEQVKDRRVLYLAAFLHDIGKGLGRDHARRGAEMAPGIAARLGLGLEASNALSFLVTEHVFLIETATRRDLTEEKLIFTCAQKIGQIDLLNMLYLLNVADARATGPQAWNQWRASLLRDLYTKVFHVLSRSDLAGQEEARRRESIKAEVKELLKGRLDDRQVETMLDNASAHYFSVMTPSQVAHHLELETRLKDEIMVWDLKASPEGYYEVTILTGDRPGLLSDLAGAFSLNNINILGAQVFTRASGIAMDIFHVEPPPDALRADEAWDKVRRDTLKVLSGKLVPGESLPLKKPVFKRTRKLPRRPSRVLIDNNTSDFYTIIEVYTYDRLGLLHDLTRTIFDLGLTIYIAKISTKVDQVVDVFYVRDLDGQKIDDPAEVKRFEEALKSNLKI